MKKLHIYKIIILFIISFLIINKGESQVLINSAGGTPDPSSILEVRSTTQGLLIPRMNTTERNSIINPADGLLVFDSQQNSFYIFGDNKWNDLSTPAGIWETSSSNVYLSSSYTNVGIGTVTPDGKLVIKADKSKGPDDALFEIQDVDGKTIFEVTSEGARLYVKDYPNSKGVSGGFAVGRYGTAKGVPGETFFMVTPDSTRVYTKDSGKGVSGGFAVGRYGTAKGVPDTLFFETSVYGTTVTVFEDKAKGVAGGFAVGRYGTAKGDIDSLCFYTTVDSTRVYTGGGQALGASGGFAVGRYGTAKGGTDNYMFMVPDNYLIGHQSGEKLQSGDWSGKYNTFFGYQSGMNDTIGGSNVFIGYKSGLNNVGKAVTGPIDTLGSRNVFIGYESGLNNTDGADNVFMGTGAGYSNTTGFANVFIGNYAGYTNDRIPNPFPLGTGNVFIGDSSGYGSRYGSTNLFAGLGAGQNNQDGSSNVFLGHYAGKENNDGGNNVFMGYHSGCEITDSWDNTFMGYCSGRFATGGNQNIFIGPFAGYYQESGDKNIYIGNNAGKGTSSTPSQGTENVFIGTDAGSNNYTGEYNVFLGNSSGNNNYNGRYNVFLGRLSGFRNYSGSKNVFLGDSTGYSNISGNYNTFIGTAAGRNNSGGDHNTVLGYNAGFEGTIGNNQTLIGYRAGMENDGQANVFVGYDAGKLSAGSGNDNVGVGSNALLSITGNHNTAIGSAAGRSAGTGNVFVGYHAGMYETGDNKLYIDNMHGGSTLIYGEFDNKILEFNGDVGIGITPTETLDVNGKTKTLNFQMTTGASSGYILQSDATGNASWVQQSSLDDNDWTVSGTNMYSAVTGNVGIGTSAPEAPLDVETNASGYAIHIEESTGTDNEDWQIGVDSRGDLNFFDSGTSRITFEDEGNVGIGIANPIARLDVRSSGSGDILNLFDGTTEVFTVIDGGNVGIGTTTPGQPLDVNGDVETGSGTAGDGDAEWISIRADSDNWYMGVQNETTVGESDFYIGKDFDEDGIFHIENDGDVGIGTTTPGSHRLSVISSATSLNGATGYFENTANGISGFFNNSSYSSTDCAVLIVNRGTGNILNLDSYGGFSTGWDRPFVFTNSGRLGIGNTSPSYRLQLSSNSAAKPTSSVWTISSDIRLKDIKGEYKKGLDEILLLEPVIYRYKKDNGMDIKETETDAFGLIAQDVSEIFPEAVGLNDKGFLGLDIHPILIAEINAFKTIDSRLQKQEEQIENQNSEIQELKKQIQELKELIQNK